MWNLNDLSFKKYKIDFSLIPIGVLILEFSIFNTEIHKRHYLRLTDLALMRLLHTIIILTLAYCLSKIVQKSKKLDFTYIGICALGLPLSICGLLINRTLSSGLNIENTSLYRSIAASAVQNFIWLPAFMIIGSIRTEIFESFRSYENRLITSIRSNFRESEQYKSEQNALQKDIRLELRGYTKALSWDISSIEFDRITLEESNSEIQSHLIGKELRLFSMKLQSFGSEKESASFLGQNLKSVKLLTGQFRILYAASAKIAPLKAQTYTFVLLILVTPAFINFFSLFETLVALPIIAFAVYLCARYITRLVDRQSKNYLRNSSLLIYFTALIPLITNRISNSVHYDPNTAYPIYIGAITLPIGYYVFIKLLQVLKVQTVNLVRDDRLDATPAVRLAIYNLIRDEFAHALSHRWAIYIHGNILTRLAATSLKLETATNLQDRKAFEGAINDLLVLLAEPDAKFDQEVSKMEDEIASRLDPWLGLIDIDLYIDPDLQGICNPQVAEVGEVVEEVVSNSMRHGKARKIELRVIRVGDKDIEISSKDDAEVPPPIYHSRYGLGSRIFNLASDSRWSIERVDSATVFKLIMNFKS
ncbi:hypothetical protein MCEMRE254_01025 [Candidatus Nanopelagicaceae bacterium]